MKYLDGKQLSDFIKERQAHQVASLGKAPVLAIIRDNDSPVIDKYVTLKIHYGADIGVTVHDFLVPTTGLASTIEHCNSDPAINGIILQLPITDKSQTDHLTGLIVPQKDVDGLSGHGNFDSATATAILWLLSGYDINLKSAKIAIVGRGKLVGAPLYQMFTASNYDVTLFHRGDDLTNLTKFDIIITATGVPGLIQNAHISPGAVIVDAGTASEDGVIKGDVSDEVRARTDLTAITPEKGGVGPLTVSCLFDHVIFAANK